MLDKLKSPVVIISALAFVAMAIVFVSHFQLVGTESASVQTAPSVERPAVETASLPSAPAVETPEVVAPAVPEVLREVTYEEAEAAYRDRRYHDAADLFAAYADRKFENPWGFYMLGLSAWKADEYERAELAFEQAIELDPTHVKSYINLTRTLLDAGKSTDALVRINQALDLDPQSGVAHRLHGVTLHAIGNREAAIDAYRKAIEIDNADAWAMNDLALALIEGGDYDEALRALARATELRDDVAVFFNNLGMALELSGRFVQATDAYDRAVTLDGGYTRAVDNLNRVATVLEDPTLAAIDLAALAAEFVDDVAGWSDAVVASGTTESIETVEPVAPAVVAAPADTSATGNDR